MKSALYILMGLFLCGCFETPKDDRAHFQERLPLDMIATPMTKEDILFFKRRMPLFLSVGDLKNVRNYLKQSIQFEKDLYNPMTVFTGKPFKQPEIDLDAIAENYLQTRPYSNKEVHLAILFDSREKAKALSAKFKNTEQFSQCLDDLIPTEQEEKILVLKNIKKILTPQVLKFLDGDERKFAEGFIGLEIYKPFQEKDLPPSVLARFTEKDGNRGRVVYIGTQHPQQVKETLAAEKPKGIVVQF